MLKKSLLTAAVVLVGLAVLIQLLPLGRVDNPPVVQEPTWDSPQTRALAERACFDCHSNQVQVPWYGHVAPFSWLVADHVADGRRHLNFSEMNRPQEDAEEAGEEVAEGAMPPSYYPLLHADARLTEAERRQLQAGLDATLGGEVEVEQRGRRGRRHDDDDDD